MPRRKPDPERRCRFCGRRLHRKTFNGRLEDMGVFMRRVYCDRFCMAQEMVQQEVSKSAHHWRARRHRKDQCDRCGGTEGLHAHHRDLDFRNDDPENIETLCATCHLEGHWALPDGKHAQARRMVNANAFDRLIAACEMAVDDLGDCPTAVELVAAVMEFKAVI